MDELRSRRVEVNSLFTKRETLTLTHWSKPVIDFLFTQLHELIFEQHPAPPTPPPPPKSGMRVNSFEEKVQNNGTFTNYVCICVFFLSFPSPFNVTVLSLSQGNCKLIGHCEGSHNLTVGRCPGSVSLVSGCYYHIH